MSALTKLKKRTKRRRPEVEPGEAYIRGHGAEFHSRGYEGLPEQETSRLRKVGATLRQARPTTFQERVTAGWRPADETQRGRDILASAPKEVLRAYYRGEARPIVAPAGARYTDKEATVYGETMTPRERESFGLRPGQSVPLSGLQALRRWRRTRIAADRTGQVQRYTVEGEAFPRKVHPASAVGKLRERVGRAVPREAAPAVQDRDAEIKKRIALGDDKGAIDILAGRSKNRAMARDEFKRIKARMDKGPTIDPRAKLRYEAADKEVRSLEPVIRKAKSALDGLLQSYAAGEGSEEVGIIQQRKVMEAEARRREADIEELEGRYEKAVAARDAALDTATGAEKQVAQDRRVDKLIERGPMEQKAGRGPVRPTMDADIDASGQRLSGMVPGGGPPAALGAQPEAGGPSAQPTAQGEPAAGTHPDIAVSLQAIQAQLAEQGYQDASEQFIEAAGAVINGYKEALKGILREMKPKDYKLFVQWCVEVDAKI